MVALPEVLHRKLPVPGRGIGLACGDLRRAEAVVFDIGVKAISNQIEFDDSVIALFGKTDKDKPLIDACPARVKRPVLRPEIIGHRSCPDEFALKVPGPGVIGAGEGADMIACLRDDSRPTVAADIEERAHLPVPASHQDDRFSGNLVCENVPGLGNRGDMVDVKPLSGDDAVEILLEDVRVRVERLLERHPGLLAHQEVTKRDRTGRRHAVTPPAWVAARDCHVRNAGRSRPHEKRDRRWLSGPSLKGRFRQRYTSARYSSHFSSSQSPFST